MSLWTYLTSSTCYSYSNDKLKVGDLVFFADTIYPPNTPSSLTLQYVAMVTNVKPSKVTVIREDYEQGVILETHHNLCDAVRIFSTVEVKRFNLDKNITQKAVEIALNEVGDEYNYRLTPEHADQNGNNVFYASQLIQYAYNEANKAVNGISAPTLIPSELTYFRSPADSVKPGAQTKWQKYFATHGMEAPVAQYISKIDALYEHKALYDICDLIGDSASTETVL